MREKDNEILRYLHKDHQFLSSFGSVSLFPHMHAVLKYEMAVDKLIILQQNGKQTEFMKQGINHLFPQLTLESL